MGAVVLWAAAASCVGIDLDTATVGGKVTDLRGNPLPGVVIRVGEADSHQTVSDASGRYLVAGLPAGTYRLSFAMPGVTRRIADVSLEVLDHHVLDMVLAIDDPRSIRSCICDPVTDEPKPESTVKARDIWLVDPDGRPVPGARVVVRGQPVVFTSDAEGHACFDAHSRQTFRVTDENFQTSELDVCCVPRDGRVTLWP